MAARNTHSKHVKSIARFFSENLYSYYITMFPLVASVFALFMRYNALTFVNIIATFILVPIVWTSSAYVGYYERTHYRGMRFSAVLKKKSTTKSERSKILRSLVAPAFVSLAVPYVLNFVVLFQQNLVHGWGIAVAAYGIAEVLGILVWPSSI